MPETDLIVLKAGIPPVRGRKLRYFAEPAFRRRLRPPPHVAPAVLADDPALDDAPAASSPDPLTLEAIVPMLADEGLEPLPPEGATPAEVEAWVERFIDATTPTSAKEPSHG